jgi:hypothetical protein
MPTHICCYSGGHSSAISAIEVRRRFPNDEVLLVNHDIIGRSESPDIKRFKQEVADYLSLPITYVNMPGWDTKDQFDVVIEAKAFKVGNGTALCTNRLKTRPFEEWLRRFHSPSSVTIYYGFDSNEQDRITRRSTILGLMGFRTDYPVALWSPRTIYTTEEIGILRPNTYEQFKHANCIGCLKAGRQHWYCVFCLRPDVWAKAKIAEDEIGYTIIKGVSLDELEPLFIQMREAGVIPTEHIPPAKFWADAKKRIKGLQITEDSNPKPCECAC